VLTYFPDGKELFLPQTNIHFLTNGSALAFEEQLCPKVVFTYTKSKSGK